MSKEKLVYTVAEVAELLGLSLPTTYAAIKDGSIPSLVIGRRILIPKIRFHEILNTNIGSIYLENQMPDIEENVEYQYESQNGIDLIYLIQMEPIRYSELFKVGYSCEIQNRLNTIQIFQPRARLIKTWSGNISLETEIHKQLKKDGGCNHVRNELYECKSSHYLVLQIEKFINSVRGINEN